MPARMHSSWHHFLSVCIWNWLTDVVHAFILQACASSVCVCVYTCMCVCVCVCSYSSVAAPGKCQGLKWRFDKGMGTETWQEGERAYTQTQGRRRRRRCVLEGKAKGISTSRMWTHRHQIQKVYWGSLMSRHSLLPSSPLTHPTPSCSICIPLHYTQSL